MPDTRVYRLFDLETELEWVQPEEKVVIRGECSFADLVIAVLDTGRSRKIQDTVGGLDGRLDANGMGTGIKMIMPAFGLQWRLVLIVGGIVHQLADEEVQERAVPCIGFRLGESGIADAGA